MSTITKLIVDVTAKGMEKLKGDSQQFHDNMVKGAAATKKAVLAASAPAKSVAAARQESQDYGVSRSLRPGGTGAGARDFAQEAQGLGGLVRLYATYAANIFAVGAAFTALSNAMDTTNMVKGLDQLGAASGTALGTLSKQLVTATDGAVSLREAMEATVKASSSGMSNKDILRMGEAAQKASLALGVNMSDALSRISRGITKLEPELLDELGLFVRVDDAVKDYAKSVNKSTSDITEFERRMAFANATLDQAEKKFGAIDIEANPYTQLLAKIKDLGQTVGEVLNVALVPLINILSSSPLALGTVIAGLATMLVKQAIPAIGEVRKAFEASAQEAKDAAALRYKDLQAFALKEKAFALKDIDEKAQIAADRFHSASDQLVKINEDTTKKLSTASKKGAEIAAKAYSDVTQEEIAWLKKHSEAVNKKTGEYTKASVVYKQQYDAIIQAQKLEQQYMQDAAKYDSERQAALKSLNTETQNHAIYRRELSSAQSKEISSNAAYIGSIKGIRAAWSELNSDIAQARSGTTSRMIELEEFDRTGKRVTRTVEEITPQMSALRAGVTRAAGAFGIITGALTTALNFAGPWIAVIGLAIAAIGLFDGWASKASKQMDTFNGTLKASADALGNVDRTLDLIANKNPAQVFNLESLQAVGNALQNLGDNTVSLVKNFEDVKKNQGIWDKITNGIAGIFNADISDNLADSLSEGFEKLSKRLPNDPNVQKARKDIANLLNLSENFSTDKLKTALEKTADAGNTTVLEDYAKILRSIGIEAQNTASRVDELNKAITGGKEVFRTFAEQFANKDPMVALGNSMINMSQKFTSALKEPEKAIGELAKISRDLDAIKLFGPEDQANLIKYSSKLNELNSEQGRLSILANKQQQALNDQYQQLSRLAESASKAGDTQTKRDITSQMNILGKQAEAGRVLLENTRKQLEKVQGDIRSTVSVFGDTGANLFKTGADYTALAISSAFAKGGAELKKAAISGLGNVPGVAALNANIANQELEVERSLLSAQLELIKATHENTVVQRLRANQEQTAELERTASTLDGAEAVRLGVNTRLSDLKAEKSLLEIRVKGFDINPRNLPDTIRNIGKEFANSSEQVRASAKGVIDYLNNIAGLSSKILNIDDKKAANNFKAKLETMAEEAELNKHNIAQDKERIALSEQAVSREIQKRGYATEAELIQLRSFAIDQAKNDEKIKLEDILLREKSITESLLVLEGKSKLTEEQKTALAKVRQAQTDLTNEKTAAAEKKDADIAAARLKTEQELQARLFKRIELQDRLVLLQQESSLTQSEYALEIEDIQNNAIQNSRLLSTEEKGLATLKLSLAKEDSALRRKLFQEEVSYIAKIKSILKDLNDSNINEINALVQEEFAAYNQRIANDTNLSEERKKNLRNSFDISKDAALLDGVSDGIMTALFEGGKEGSKKIRDTLKAQLREPVQIVVNALINPITSAINTMVSGATTGIMNSAVSSIFGAGSTLTSVAGTFGKSIASGFTSTVQGWFGMSGTSAQMATGFAQTGLSSGGSAASLGANIGTYLPYVAVAAIVLNVLGVFRKTKQVQSALTGMLGEGDIKDVKVMRKSGTLLSGPKYWVEELGINKGSSMIQEAFAAMKSNTIDMAKSLGLATDQVKNFTTTLGTDELKGGLGKIGINLTGEDGKQLSEQEVAGKINEALATANNELAQLIIGTWEDVTTDVTRTIETITGGGDSLEISSREVTESVTERIYKESEYAKLNETAIETLTRLATSLQATNGFFELIGHNMFEASLAGGDLASKLVDASGGLDQFNSEASFFFQNFYTEAEQFEMKSNVLNKGLKRLADDDSLTLTLEEVTKLTDGVGDAKEEYKALVLAQDLNTEAGRKTYAALMDLAPAFSEIASAADATKAKVEELAGNVSLTVDSLSQIMVDGFMNGVDGADIGKMIANTIQRGMYQAMISGVTNSIAQMIYSQILSPMLASIVTSGTIVGAVSQATITEVVNKATAMITALAQVLNSPEFQSVIAQLGGLANINFGGISVPEAYNYGPSAADQAKDAKDAAFKAMDDAFSALKKSVDAQKKLLQEQVKLAEEQIKKIEDLINVLDSNIKELRGSVTETAAMQAAQGNQFIKQALQQAIATGALPDSEELSEAIGAVRAEIDLGNYDSKFAEDRAKLLLAGQLDQLKALGLDQKTDAELQLEALNKQIEDLDKLVEAYQLQIDAIKGVDSSVKSVAEAIARLESAIAGAASAGGSSSGGGFTGGGGTGGTTGDKLATLGFKSRVTKDYTGVYNSGVVSESNGTYTYSSGISDAGGFSAGPTAVDSLTSSKAWTTTGYAANNKDVVDYYNANKSIIAQLGQASSLAEYLNYHFITYGIAENRKFAKGGIFDNSIVTAPTLFNSSLMGEAGPEAIMPLGKMPDGSLGVRGTGGNNAELIAEIKNLKAELTHMKQYVAKTSTSTEESRKLLDEVVRGGSAITVESEIASY